MNEDPGDLNLVAGAGERRGVVERRGCRQQPRDRSYPGECDPNLAGARYLRELLDRFQSPDLALAAYNAGPTAVADARGAPTLATATYVANVDEIWRELRGCK